MVTPFPFPSGTPKPEENTGQPEPNGNVLHFERKKEVGRAGVQAYMLEGITHIGIGSDIAVDLLGKIYIATMVDILEKDAGGNIIKIMYNIHHLESGDPFKIGEADFTYIVKAHE
jgi:hypothetical protein